MTQCKECLCYFNDCTCHCCPHTCIDVGIGKIKTNTHPQNPEQTTQSPTWAEEYRARFNDFPTSALWYEPVMQFIQTKIDQAKAEARAEMLEEVLHKVFPGKLGPGDPSIDPDGAEYKRGWDEALTQYYKNIQALESKQH